MLSRMLEIFSSAPERVERVGIDFVAAALVTARFEDRPPDRIEALVCLAQRARRAVDDRADEADGDRVGEQRAAVSV
jgi:hypothetical protein